jgi:hypothetical protein
MSQPIHQSPLCLIMALNFIPGRFVKTLFHPWDIKVFTNLPGRFIYYFGVPWHQGLKITFL